MPRKVVVTKQRSVHMYSELWHAAGCVVEAGVQNPAGSSWQFLSGVVLTAFAFEAYLNHVGSRTFECWEELDRLPPLAKLELLCEKLNVEFADGFGARPLQTVGKVLTFRNAMAHGRSMEVEAKPLLRTTENYHAAYNEDLLVEWQKLIRSDEFAKRAREDVRCVLERLHDARTDEKEWIFEFGSGTYGATLVNEP
jgi:hypothetical protein